MTLLTAIEPAERHALTDAVRAIAWSPEGRVLSLGADGRAGRSSGDRLTAPIGPDPIACCWITNDRVAVLDGLSGVISAGGGAVTTAPMPGPVGLATPSLADGSVGAYCVAFGRDGLSVIHADPTKPAEPTTIETGPLRAATHLGGAIWLVGGAEGLCVVDVALGIVDQRIDLPGVVTLAAASSAGRIAAADSTGSIHVLELARLEDAHELTGYPDAVRYLGVSPTGDVVVACADDELTWWAISPDGTIADSPECSIGHDAPISACAAGTAGFIATGDAHGLVRLWSPALRDVALASFQLDSEITVLSWSRSGERLAIGTIEGEVVIADIAPGELL